MNETNNTAIPATDLEQAISHEPPRAEKITPLDTQCRLHVHSVRKRLTDADGVSAKAAIDGLIHAGLLYDDSPAFVQSVSYSQEKAKKGETEYTVLTIEGVT